MNEKTYNNIKIYSPYKIGLSYRVKCDSCHKPWSFAPAHKIDRAHVMCQATTRGTWRIDE